MESTVLIAIVTAIALIMVDLIQATTSRTGSPPSPLWRGPFWGWSSC